MESNKVCFSKLMFQRALLPGSFWAGSVLELSNVNVIRVIHSVQTMRLSALRTLSLVDQFVKQSQPVLFLPLRIKAARAGWREADWKNIVFGKISAEMNERRHWARVLIVSFPPKSRWAARSYLRAKFIIRFPWLIFIGIREMMFVL